MMVINKIIGSLLMTIFLSCGSYAQNKPVCKKYYIQSNNFVIKQNADSAIFYIDKAIKCNPKDVEYKIKKTELLIVYNKYEQAYKFLSTISDSYMGFDMFQSVIALKLGKPDSREQIEETYKNIKDKKNINTQYFTIVFANYLKGNDYALKEIEKFQKEFDSNYFKQLTDTLKRQIKNNSGKEVLFNTFNIQ